MLQSTGLLRFMRRCHRGRWRGRSLCIQKKRWLRDAWRVEIVVLFVGVKQKGIKQLTRRNRETKKRLKIINEPHFSATCNHFDNKWMTTHLCLFLSFFFPVPRGKLTKCRPWELAYKYKSWQLIIIIMPSCSSTDHLLQLHTAPASSTPGDTRRDDCFKLLKKTHSPASALNKAMERSNCCCCCWYLNRDQLVADKQVE